MHSHYNQNYSFEDVKSILSTIKQCASVGRFVISFNDNRQENIDFVNEYNIRPSLQKSLLLQIKAEDFCHSLQNTKKGYEEETLYVFAPLFELYDSDGKKENVRAYVKFNILAAGFSARTIVISFHKLNRPIDYLFQ